MSQGETATSVPSWPAESSTPAGAQLHAWVRAGRSFSGREPNCCFLNTRGPRFADISAISGVDFADDARSLGVTDWDHDGDLDLWIANRSSPQLRFLRNENPTSHHFVAFRLRGRTCNRDAVGARVEVHLADDAAAPLIKTVRAGEGYLGQSSLWLHFGLGSASRIERLVVRWPGGEVEQWTQVPLDGAYEVVQGEPQLRRRPSRKVQPVLAPAPLSPLPARDETQRFLAGPLPLPPLSYQTWDGREVSLLAGRRPQLLVLWATWCQPCVLELQQLAEPAMVERLGEADVQVVTLSVDQVAPGDEPAADPQAPRRLLEQLGAAFPAGRASSDLLDKLQMVHNQIFDRHRPLPLPCSLLVDADGRLAAIYKGPVAAARILDDVAALSLSPEARRQRSVPWAGRWLAPVAQPRPSSLAWALLDQSRLAEAIQYTEDHRQALLGDDRFAELLVHLGNRLMDAGQIEDAMAQYQTALRVNPQLSPAHLNLAVAQVKQRDFAAAAHSLQRALEYQPDYAQAHYQLGVLMLRARQVAPATEHLRRAVNLRPNQREYRLALANAAVAAGDLRQAAEQLEVALVADDRDAPTWAQLASVQMRLDREAQAIGSFRRALALRPDWPPVLDSLAWLLATAQDSQQRDPATAVQLAERASQTVDGQQAKRLDTLAAAYAAAGRFEDAVRTAVRAERLARQSGQDRLAAGIAQRLTTYRAGRPLVP